MRARVPYGDGSARPSSPCGPAAYGPAAYGPVVGAARIVRPARGSVVGAGDGGGTWIAVKAQVVRVPGQGAGARVGVLHVEERAGPRCPYGQGGGCLARRGAPSVDVGGGGVDGVALARLGVRRQGEFGDECRPGTIVQGDVEETGPGDLHTAHPVLPFELAAQHPRHVVRRRSGRLGDLEGDADSVVPVTASRRRVDGHALGHPETSVAGSETSALDGATHCVQHGAGELGGCHGASVWERGWVKANRFHPLVIAGA